MSKQDLIDKTVVALQQLPADKVAEVSDFTDFILQRNEDKLMVEGIEKMTSESKSYKFQEEEEDLYTLNDVKAPYNGKS